MIYYAAKAIIFNPYHLNKVLLGKRSITGGYEPLGGTLQEKENFEEALHREIKEEAGMSVERLKYIGTYKFQWYTNPNNHTVCVLFECSTVYEPVKQENKNELEIIPEYIAINKLAEIPIHFLQKEFRKLLQLFYNIEHVDIRYRSIATQHGTRYT